MSIEKTTGANQILTSDGLGASKLAAQTEANIRRIVSEGKDVSDIAAKLDQYFASLPLSEREILKGELTNESGFMLEFLKKSIGRDHPFISKGRGSHFCGTGIDGPRPRDFTYPPEIERALAAQGESEAMVFCKEEFTIDEWNYYRTEGHDPEAKGMEPVSPGKTDEMIAALGGDRNKKISAEEYNRLMGTKEPVLTPIIQTPIPIEPRDYLYPPSTERALAAQGEFAFCSEEFTIDEWNYFRTEGDGAEVKPMDPVSAERTDEMVAALGGDRSKKISHREYNRLMGSHLDHRQIEQLMLREIR